MIKAIKRGRCTLALSVVLASAAVCANGIPDDVGMRVELAGNDVYRVSVQVPSGPGSERQVKPVAGSNTVLRIDPDTGDICIYAGADSAASILWQGRVRPLAGYGRMQGAGLELEWDAQAEERIYGLGEQFNRLDLRGRKVHMWVSDDFAQGEGQTYYCTPVLYSSANYALFAADNPEGDFELAPRGDGRHHYRRAGSKADFYLAFGPTLKSLALERGRLQGPMRSIPDWAWGPWISRSSYPDQAAAEAVIGEMVRRDLPVAAIVQEAWKGPVETGQYNQYDPGRWPDLDRYFKLCTEHDIKTILWQVPIIHPRSPEYAEAAAKGFFVKRPDGSVSPRLDWLPDFAHVDFSNPEAAAWWKDWLRPLVRMGVYGFKADDGEAIRPDDVFFNGLTGVDMHNQYTVLNGRTLTELFDEEGVPGLLWSRAASLGSERYPALWAGDQCATWGHYRSLVAAGLSASLSGMPFWGHDIGGYSDNPTPELYVRWLQFGAFSPLMQYHGMKSREPWEFGPAAEAAYKLFAHLRMNLRPTWMALGRETAATGLPIMRPMAMEFPDDPRFADEDSQYMLGPDILVAPVFEEGALGRRVKFPAGTWHHLLQPVSFTGPADVEVSMDWNTPPAFVREGATLKVELDPDADLGQWRHGAPVRELAFDENRAVIRNPRIPLYANILKPAVQLAFETTAPAEGEWEAVWHTPGATNSRAFTVQRSGENCSVDLALSAEDTEFDFVKILKLRTPGAAKPAYAIPVHWRSPLRMELAGSGPHVVGSGVRELQFTLRNLAEDGIAYQIAADAGTGLNLADHSRTGFLEGGATASLSWPVTVESTNRLGDARVRFSLESAGRLLDRKAATFTRPAVWIAAGPFFPSGLSAFHEGFPAEWNTDPAAEFVTRGVTASWVRASTGHVEAHQGVDFCALYGYLENCAAYALTRIVSDREQPVELRFGSDDTLTVWMNGQQVYAAETYRPATWDQEIAPATLQAGTNTMLIKVAQSQNPWRFLFRVTAPGGGAVEGLRDGFDDIGRYAPAGPDKVIER